MKKIFFLLVAFPIMAQSSELDDLMKDIRHGETLNSVGAAVRPCGRNVAAVLLGLAKKINGPDVDKFLRILDTSHSSLRVLIESKTEEATEKARAAIREEADALKEEKDTLIRQLEKQKAMTLEAEGKRDAFAHQVTELETQLEEKKKALIETEAKTTTLGTTNKSLVRQLEEQKAMTLEAEKQAAQRTTEVEALRTKLEQAKRSAAGEKREHQAEVTTLRKEYATRQAAQTKEIQRLQEQFSDKERALTAEIGELQEKLSQKERESQQVKDEIEEVRVERSASIRTNGKEIRALKTKLEQTEIQLAEYKKMFNDQLGTIGALDGWDHISEAQLRARIKEAENKKKPSSLKARTATVEVPDNRSDTGSVRSTRSRFSLSSLWGGGTPKAAPRRTSLEPQDPVADDPSTAEAFDHAGAFSTPIVGERAIEKDQADGATDSLSDVSLNEEKAEQKPASGSSGGGILGWFNRKPSTPIAAPNPPAPQKDADGSKYTYTTGTPRSLGGNTPKSSSPLNPNPLTSPVLTPKGLHTPVKPAATVTGGRPSDASSETNGLDSGASSAASSPARMVSHKPAKPSPLRSGNTPSRPAQLDTKEEGLFGGESPDRPQPFGPVKLESDDRAKSSSLARSRSDGRPAPISTGSPPLTNRGLARSASVGPRERSHSADSNERKDSPIVVAEGFQRALPLGISPMKGGAFDFPAASVHDGKDLKQANSVSPITDNRETEAPQPISTSEDNALSSAVPAPSISPHAGTPGKDYQASSTENPQKKKRPSLVVNTTAPGASAAPPPPSSLKEGGLKQKGPRSLPSSPTAATVARASSALKESPPASSKGMQPSASPTNHMPAK
jgi:hypothetical protein